MDSVTQFNGTTTDYDYDQADRLTGIRHETAAGLLVDYDYQLDANGNRAIVTIDNEPILPEQLIDATQSQRYNSTKNRLTGATIDGQPIAFSYDNEGQLQTKGNTTFTFDAAHRLTGYADKQFSYDGVGNRIKSIRNGVTSQYVYDAAGNLLAEADQAGTIKRYYLHGLGLMAMVDAQTNQLYVYHFDGTGHTVAMTDAAQNIVNRYAYDPYGRVLGKDETVVQPFTYVGQAGAMTEADGLYYMRARYYDEEVGRFISEDPAGFVDGPNLYAYVGGNPIMLVDPSGLEAAEEFRSGRAESVCPSCYVIGGWGALKSAVGIGRAFSSAATATIPRAFRSLSGSGKLIDPADKAGQLTRAGRALQKHGSRKGSAFPVARGNPAQINQQGQQVLDEILGTSGSVGRSAKRFGGIDVIAPGGRGARFDAEGVFRGFLEP